MLVQPYAASSQPYIVACSNILIASHEGFTKENLYFPSGYCFFCWRLYSEKSVISILHLVHLPLVSRIHITLAFLSIFFLLVDGLFNQNIFVICHNYKSYIWGNVVIYFFLNYIGDSYFAELCLGKYFVRKTNTKPMIIHNKCFKYI